MKILSGKFHLNPTVYDKTTAHDRLDTKIPRAATEFHCTDASDNTIAALLLETDDAEDYHPVAYLSRKLTLAEKNYTIAEKETLAVVYALKNWRLYLFKHFEIFSDIKAVIYL